MTEGYFGKPINGKHIFWKRGVWKIGITGAAKSDDSTNPVGFSLISSKDFQEEKVAVQMLVEARRHMLSMSPKCHPEHAGFEIEYSWGNSKLEFVQDQRRELCSLALKSSERLIH